MAANLNATPVAVRGQMRGEAQVYIAAPPEEVFRLISDVTRMGEWSPECRRCDWIGESVGPVAGARFRGRNRRGWLRWGMQCRVTEVEPGRAFAFETVPFAPFRGKAQTRWRYEMEPEGNGTVLKESFEVLWFVSMIVRLGFGGSTARQAQLETGVQDTLARIKEVAEAS